MITTTPALTDEALLPSLSQTNQAEPQPSAESMPQQIRQRQGKANKYAINIPLTFYQNLSATSKQRALGSGALAIVAADLDALIGHARAMAQEVYRAQYDPMAHAADKLRDDEFHDQKSARDEVRVKTKHAETAVAEAAAALAALGENLVPEPPSLWLQATATVIIALTVGVTLHDQIFVFTDDVMAWLVSSAVALLCALFVTLQSVTKVQRTAFNWFGLVGGIVIGLGFMVVRLTGATEFSQWAIGLGLTAVEIGAVLCLHYAGERYREALATWRLREAEHSKARRQLDAAQTHLTTCQAQLAQLNDEIEAHISYVDERSVRHHQIQEIEALAVKAVTDGYHEGISENLGRTRRPKKGAIQ